MPDSRRGPADHGVPDGQARICCEKTRDKHDVVIVQEKLDGSNVAVARVNGELVALGRAGWPAQSSRFEQHQLFAHWVRLHWDRFDFLQEGEWFSGEWLAQAHGTKYDLYGRNPFVVFDMFSGGKRVTCKALEIVAQRYGFTVPPLLSCGGVVSIESAMQLLGEYGHYGALDPVEGVVYRVERKGVVDFLAKYVRPEKVDGLYLPEMSGAPAIWNWRPE